MPASLTKEIKDKTLAAAEAIYRLTGIDIFDAALKSELRTRAVAIVSRAASFSISAENKNGSAEEYRAAIAADLEAIKELVRFACRVRLISAGNADLVIGAYCRIRGYVDEAILGRDGAERTAESPPEPDESAATILNERQKRIVGYLESAGQAQISDIRGVFGNECSEKTLQRDLWQLVQSGLIQRKGDNRWTTYIAAAAPAESGMADRV